MVRTAEGLRAVNNGRFGNPERIEKHLVGRFGSRLDDARVSMKDLTPGHRQNELRRRGSGPMSGSGRRHGLGREG